MTAPGATSLGAFAVATGTAELAAFRLATGLAGGSGVPLTFPMRWLALPEVRTALLAMVPEPDVVPVHESQSFDYVEPLKADEPYHLAVSARRETSPDRLIVEGVVSSAGGGLCARLETILRLVSTAGAAA